MGRTPGAAAPKKGPKKAPAGAVLSVLPAAARISGLRLRDFKGFHDVHLDLGGLTVVVGANASGKSNLRDAFRFLHGIGRGYTLAEIIGEKWAEGGVLQWRGIRGGTAEIAHDGSKSFSVEVDLVSPGEGGEKLTYFIEVGVPEIGAGSGPEVLDEWLRIGSRRESFSRALASQRTRPGLAELAAIEEKYPNVFRRLVPAARESRADGAALSALASMRFFDLSPDALRLPSIPGQTVLGDRGENLSSVLQAICAEETKRRALVEWIRALTPLDVVDLRFHADQTGRILLSLVEENGRETSAHSASDGTLRFLAMVAAFLGPDPARFNFFEELDTGLHPTRLHLLLGLIEKQVKKRSIQVVATTHSPSLLSHLSPESLESAALAYRLPGERSQRLTRILDLPDARRALETHDIAELHGTGWLENAVALASPAESERSRAAE